jgi:hypothetical protein
MSLSLTLGAGLAEWGATMRRLRDRVGKTFVHGRFRGQSPVSTSLDHCPEATGTVFFSAGHRHYGWNFGG